MESQEIRFISLLFYLVLQDFGKLLQAIIEKLFTKIKNKYYISSLATVAIHMFVYNGNVYCICVCIFCIV